MDNKTLIKFLYVLVIVVIITLLGGFTTLDVVITYGSSIVFLTMAYYLVKNGDFIHSSQFNYLGFGALVFMVGALFKIQHYPYASLMICSGPSILFFIYLIYFLKRRVKSWISYLKLVFLITFLGGKVFTIMHWPYGALLTVVSAILLIVIFIAALLKNRESGNNETDPTMV